MDASNSQGGSDIPSLALCLRVRATRLLYPIGSTRGRTRLPRALVMDTAKKPHRFCSSHSWTRRTVLLDSIFVHRSSTENSVQEEVRSRQTQCAETRTLAPYGSIGFRRFRTILFVNRDDRNL
jgi:hypothetical protein